MKDDLTLMREFISERSESAFAELVQRHIDLVYSVALRHTHGDAHLARDITQNVFCELARKAPSLRNHRTVTGWLYNTARFIASRHQRTESRRHVREQVFAMNSPQETSITENWNDVQEVLDDAMADLHDEDREAVILRYFRNESLVSIGAILGASENAARMRVERALEKLRTGLERRGVRCSSAVLGAALMANAVSLAPAGLATIIAMPAAATATTLSLAQIINPLNIMSAAKLKTAAVSLALAGTTTGLVLSQRQNNDLESELASTRHHQSTNITKAEVGDSSQVLVDASELERLRAQHSELMRLRGEVTQLRNEQRMAARTPPPPPAPTGPDLDDVERERKDALKIQGIAKLNAARAWGIAFFAFAEQNGGQMPQTFEEAAQYLHDAENHFPENDLRWKEAFAEGEFEIVHAGSLMDIQNPARAIIAREKHPFNLNPDGSAHRTYLFADGHSEIYKARDGNFEPWEQERQPELKQEVDILLQ